MNEMEMEGGGRESRQRIPTAAEIWLMILLYLSKLRADLQLAGRRQMMRLRRIWNDMGDSGAVYDRSQRDVRRMKAIGIGIVTVISIFIVYIVYRVVRSAGHLPSPADQCRDRLLSMTGRCGVQYEDTLCINDPQTNYPTYYFQLPVTLTPSVGNIRETMTVERDEWCPRQSVTMPMDSKLVVAYQTADGEREMIRLTDREVSYCLQWLLSIKCN